jgi:glyoxylase-like metal-dependent hydrolase (beta-lactamase superfamily II)
MADSVQEIAPGVACLPVSIANVYFVGEPSGPWALIDTGLPKNAVKIMAAAEARFGPGARPVAILLTHGHPDHTGSATDLADAWNVPIYAHRLELPYLTGQTLYPPNDPTVGGTMALISRLFPSQIQDLGPRLLPLPSDGALPGLPEWEWHATPGHSPGHVVFYRASDRTLLAGDAFATVNLDSLPALMTKKPEFAAPSRSVTCDWGAAQASLTRLAGLRPFTVGCGHGAPLSGSWIADDLHRFAAGFTAPTHGRYVPAPAVTDENGIVSLPPPVSDPLPLRLAVGVTLTVAAGIAAAFLKRRKHH